MAKKKVLHDHKQTGKKFIPPLKTHTNLEEIAYSKDVLPEIFWLSCFIKAHGEKPGSKLALAILQILHQACKLEPYRPFAFFSLLKDIPESDWSIIVSRLKLEGLYNLVQVAIISFCRVFNDHNPLIRLLDAPLDSPQDSDVTTVKLQIAEMIDRKSQLATVVQALVLGTEIQNGQLKFTQAVEPPELNSIFDPVESEANQRAAAHSRIHVNMLFQSNKSDLSQAVWPFYFWNRGLQLEPLEFNFQRQEPLPPNAHPLLRLGRDFEVQCLQHLERICKAIPINLLESEIFEVVSGLLTRQATLAMKVATNPGIWDWDSGPLFLRPMTDCHITLAWIMKSPLERARKYVDFGLGQEKLQIEYLERGLKEANPSLDPQQVADFIAARRSWLNSQHFVFLQTVDIGSWSGKSTRDMATEADCLNLYTYAYTPWTHASHNMWNHVGRFNVTFSGNPLHRFVRVPTYTQNDFIEMDLLFRVTDYLSETFRLLEDHFKLPPPPEALGEWLSARIEIFSKEMESVEASAR